MTDLPESRAARLTGLASLFLRLGTTSFGGPAAHTAMMEDEVVRRRGWLTREQFLDLLGAVNLIPGPNSTEMAIDIGHSRAGWAGLIVAGACFILPAVVITLALAWAYVRYGAFPQVQSFLYGVKPVIIAVVVQALWRLARTAIKTKWLAAVTALALAAGFLRVNELIILFGAGIVVSLTGWLGNLRGTGKSFSLVAAIPAASALNAGAAASTILPFGLVPLFLFFLKVGAILFGSGYVLLAFLRADLVDHWHWLTETQLLDAVAAGQMTPGPAFTTATFVGYVLGGTTGAVVATVGIFLPAFVFVAISGPLVPRIRRSAVAGAFLDGVNVGSLALMAVVTWHLGRAALVDATTATLAAVALLLLIRYRVNSVWLVLAGGLIGILIAI